jgi:hypothetical protein
MAMQQEQMNVQQAQYQEQLAISKAPPPPPPTKGPWLLRQPLKLLTRPLGGTRGKPCGLAPVAQAPD